MMGPPIIQKRTRNLDCSVVSWEQYFEKCENVSVNSVNATFRVYRTGTQHLEANSVSVVFLHGAGHTALSWGLCTEEIKSTQAKCHIFAYDCRGHGATIADDEEDLSAEKLTNDCIQLINQYFEQFNSKILLVGHSMGGAIAAKAASSGQIKNLIGVVVIDVVEGTALAALSGMHTILENRPQSFSSYEDAIQWSISSGTVKNLESARLSIPSQLIFNEQPKNHPYEWRTNLSRTEPFWKGWFTDLSKTFLSAKVSKLLILAGTDRLDKDLTIAQMQGKFQLVLLPACGHTVQEDDPVKTASALLQFLQRNRLL